MAEETVLATTALIMIATGGLMGALGQGIRIIVGMKKLRDKETARVNEVFSTNRLITSLFIGFVAGSLAAFVASDENLILDISKTSLLGLLVAGYAGTDFIEGFASRFLSPGSPKVIKNSAKT